MVGRVGVGRDRGVSQRSFMGVRRWCCELGGWGTASRDWMGGMSSEVGSEIWVPWCLRWVRLIDRYGRTFESVRRTHSYTHRLGDIDDGGVVTGFDLYESMMGQEDSYAGAWESAGFGEDDHAVSAGDVAFDEVLGGRVSLPAYV